MDVEKRLGDLVGLLCSEECAGREAGTAEGLAARAIVEGAVTALGLRVDEQAIPGLGPLGGANLLAEVQGRGPLADRVVLLGAHYDHLGRRGREVYWGADDNAAAVAVLVETARRVAEAGPSRRVVFVWFDGEEPPWFLGSKMGSEVLASSGRIPLDRIDAMVAMDLVGHACGAPGLPAEVRRSLFVLGGETDSSVGGAIDEAARGVSDLFVRRLDQDVIPPMSDYEPFHRRGVPIAFLTCGRAATYHTPQDTPEVLDLGKMARTVDFLTTLALALAENPRRAAFSRDAHDDLAAVRSLDGIARAVAPMAPDARFVLARTTPWLDRLAKGGALHVGERSELRGLVLALEDRLA